MEKQNRNGITLIALVVTIVIILILAGITIGLTTSDKGVIKQAKKSKFSAEAMEIKEELERNKLLNEMQKTKYSVGSIEDLKQELQKEKQSYEDAKNKVENTILIIQEAEANLSEISSKLQELQQYIAQYLNTENTTEKTEIEEKSKITLQEINSYVANSTIEGEKLLDGTFNKMVDFGNEYYNYGKVKITIPDCNFASIYGAKEFDITDIEKISKANENISNYRMKLGAIQNSCKEGIKYFSLQIANIEDFIESIFCDENGNEATEEKAIKNAKSNNTTIKLIEMNQTILNNMNSILERIYNLALQANIMYEDDMYDQQTEIEELLKEVERELDYSIILNMNFFQGGFPYVKKINIELLGLTNISILNTESRKQAMDKLSQSMKKISSINSTLSDKMTELENEKDKEADGKDGFKIDIDSKTLELNEKHKDRFKIVNGELIYIGTNEDEKEWAKELNIGVEE